MANRMANRLFLAVVAALVLAAGPASAQDKARCQTRPISYATSIDKAWNVTGEGVLISFYASKHANGPESPDTAYLTLKPGHGFPPHKHPKGGEWLYVIKGEMEYGYWAPDMAAPVHSKLGPGAATFNPTGQIHKVWNSADNTADLEIIVHVTQAVPFEFFQDWPATFDTPGHMAEVMPWETVCPPGTELKEEL